MKFILNYFLLFFLPASSVTDGIACKASDFAGLIGCSGGLAWNGILFHTRTLILVTPRFLQSINYITLHNFTIYHEKSFDFEASKVAQSLKRKATKIPPSVQPYCTNCISTQSKNGHYRRYNDIVG